MSEEFHLLSDLALILISAGVVTIIFKLLKQPLVLGYIVAGFLVGPHFGLFPTVVESQSVEEWSEIGIIFLLFALGLEFSFKKLFKVGASAFITAGIEIVTVGCVGFLTGYFLGWSTMESVILGAMLAMSSTTIIIKAFEDLGLKSEPFADIVFVVLILQDIVAILMMVLLSTAAVSQQFSGGEMIYNIVKLLFFLILWFVIGIYFFPSFFRKFKKWINDETLLIISIGLCFGMVVIATNLGFSSALGAFVMGSILSETSEGEHIEKLIKGIKDLFGAIFFVSVGMNNDYSCCGEGAAFFRGGAHFGAEPQDFDACWLQSCADRGVLVHSRHTRHFAQGDEFHHLSDYCCGVGHHNFPYSVLYPWGGSDLQLVLQAFA